MTEEKLGQLVDRYTVRYERFYPHPVERVWRAVTTGSSLDAWMMPANRIDAWEGGRFWMGFTEGEDAGYYGTIGEFREHAVVDYVFDNGERMRFEISRVNGGTKLVFVHSFTPEIETEMGSMDVPFQHGLLAGWHMCLGNLAGFLDDDPSVTPEAALAESKLAQAGTYSPAMQQLLDLYEAHVKTLSSPS